VEPYEDGKLRVRVWERGVGLTPGCGSGASAAALSAIRRGICQEGQEIECYLDGGVLKVSYEKEVLWLKGEIKTVFTGVIDLGT
jgi:diaminopimelate epimerase